MRLTDDDLKPILQHKHRKTYIKRFIEVHTKHLPLSEAEELLIVGMANEYVESVNSSTSTRVLVQIANLVTKLEKQYGIKPGSTEVLRSNGPKG